VAAQPASCPKRRARSVRARQCQARDAHRLDLGRARQRHARFRRRALHTLIRGSTLETIADAGHIPHIEDEQAFLSILKARLALLTQR